MFNGTVFGKNIRTKNSQVLSAVRFKKNWKTANETAKNGT